MKIILSTTPIEPYIEVDGGYARCSVCWHEVTPDDIICPHCQQRQDWSWLKKEVKKNEGQN